jgi:4-hydroxybenzoate polyprenyltransferase
MTITTSAARLPVTLLGLGRVSNLPTVWTNVLAAGVLSGGDWRSWQFGLVFVAMSLFYVGGMYLNDYFDRTIDARERPERPIPSGAISARTVAIAGFCLLGGGVIAISAAGPAAVGIAMLLGIAIVTYDIHHKGSQVAPVIMGACRALVYGATVAALTADFSAFVVVSAVAIAAYVAGLTYAARQESLDKVGNLWPLALLAAPLAVSIGTLKQGLAAAMIYLLLGVWIARAVYLLASRSSVGSVSRAVGWLIAGISLCDAAILASVGAISTALVAIGGFLVTLVLQKYIAGT